MISKRRMFLGFIVVAAMMLMGVSNVLAAPFVPHAAADEEAAAEAEFTGTVVGLTETTLTVEVEEDGGTQTYTVLVPDDFDMSAVVVDETVVDVEGTVGEDGTISASKVKIEDDEDTNAGDDEDSNAGDDEDTGDVGDDDTGDVNDGEVISDTVGISDTVRIHPVGAAIAETYDVPYETVMEWRAEYKAGFGQIMLALQTGQAMGGVISPTVTAGDTLTPTIDSGTEETDLVDLATGYLQQRVGGQGWGNIWNGLGLIGHGKKAGVPVEDEDGTGDVANDPETEVGGDVGTLQLQMQTQTTVGKGKQKSTPPGQLKDRTGTGKPPKATGNSAKGKSTGKPASPGKSGKKR